MGNIVLNSKRFGSQSVFISECESTNDIALKYLKESKPRNPILFIANHQTKGRGQRGNRWLAEKGGNLTFSILWFPNNLKTTNQFLLNQISSLAIAKTITELGAEKVTVKWPNDVYVDSEKIAGILIENLTTGKFIKASVMGIGLNINQKADENINMVSLSELVKVTISKEAICEKIIKNLDYFLDAIEKKDLDINSFYESNLYAFKKNTVFMNQKGESFVGQIQGVDEHGLLKIDTNNEELKFAFKEVSLLNILE